MDESYRPSTETFAALACNASRFADGFGERYSVGELLGSGSFGVVHAAVEVRSVTVDHMTSNGIV